MSFILLVRSALLTMYVVTVLSLVTPFVEGELVLS